MLPLIFNLGPSELLIILAIVLLLFGGSRLAGLGKSTGRALKEFKEETKGLKAGETPPPPYQTEPGTSSLPTAPPAGAPYVQPPYSTPSQGDPGQPLNGSPYGEQPRAYPSEPDARRDA